jgi:osmoprotectant transport system ATP-binding protein
VWVLDPVNSTAAISLEEVSKVFPGSVSPAVDHLTLTIPHGQILALVGPSGCGKTTTLKMINRLEEPTAGKISVLGHDHRSLKPHELRRNIGYVIQQIGLFPHHSIRRNIGAVLELLKWSSDRIEHRISELIELVGLNPELLDRYPNELSGGQQQRVGVARALAADPPILLMDEPYSAVDPVIREHLHSELLQVQARVKKTIVIVTHDIDEAITLADRVVVMADGGRIEQQGTPEELLAHPATEFVSEFLGRERGLRRLGLRTVGQILGSPSGSSMPSDPGVDGLTPEDLAAVTANTPLREALDKILTSGHTRAAVCADGQRIGFITIEQIAEALRP